MTRANFTENGLNIGQNQTNMTYLYGLSDFFSVLFQDTDRLNLILEAGTEGAAEAYSRFLQLTSTISLETIQETTGSSIELVILSASSAVQGQVNLYTLPKTIVDSRFIANRPFLPTKLLEENVDYRLELATDGTVNVRFAADISTMGFSTNTDINGVKQYAMWFVDAAIDERLISTMYGNLIGVAPENSTDTFYNFVFGLYYVYVNGPTLDLVRKGLNLVLGMPLARADETVLDVRNYLQTDEYIVITDQNQYVIPFGIQPTVNPGDSIVTGQELAQWVEIQDYLSDGEWWINLQIPASVIPQLPAGQKDRYATTGSHFDYLMQNYLKKHTFLVNVKVDSFKNIQTFQQLSDIINKVKPTYTQPIYVWSVTSIEEDLTLTDDLATYRVDPSRCEKIQWPIARFHRDNTTDPIMRGCPTFLRSNVPMWVTKVLGTDPLINGTPLTANSGSVVGYINPQAQFRANTAIETGWLTAMMQRNHDQIHVRRNMVGFNRSTGDVSLSNGKAVSWYAQPAGMKVIPLYITKQYDVANKCINTGSDVPPLAQWVFKLFDPSSGSQAINTFAVNDSGTSNTISPLATYFNQLFFRDPAVGYLGALISELGMQSTYAPTAADITVADYLLGVRILEDTVGIYWVTANQDVVAPQYFPVAEMDSAIITYGMPLTRGHSGIGTSIYTLRGRGDLGYNNVVSDINAAAIENSTGDVIVPNTYTDKYNSNVTITRGGTVITHAQELL
jgi:hypothetical protein